MTVGYGVCVGSWAKFATYAAPHVSFHHVHRPLVAMYGQTSIAVAYNSILAAFQGHGLDALVLMHDDLEIVDPEAEKRFLAALQDPEVALVGVAGSRGMLSMTWWNGETLGHQYTDSGLLDFGEREGEALFIEGSIMVFSPWAIENLRFDTRYQGFLGYDDICATVAMARKKTMVVYVDTVHHSTVGFKSEQIKQSWEENEVIFREKWGTG